MGVWPLIFLWATCLKNCMRNTFTFWFRDYDMVCSWREFISSLDLTIAVAKCVKLLQIYLHCHLNCHNTMIMICIFSCGRYSREEGFTVISIDIRNQQNLLESLEQYVKINLLEGANAYHCEKCNKKVDTVKRLCIKKLPPSWPYSWSVLTMTGKGVYRIYWSYRFLIFKKKPEAILVGIKCYNS